jgi:hypothetical protein
MDYYYRCFIAGDCIGTVNVDEQLAFLHLRHFDKETQYNFYGNDDNTRINHRSIATQVIITETKSYRPD